MTAEPQNPEVEVTCDPKAEPSPSAASTPDTQPLEVEATVIEGGAASNAEVSAAQKAKGATQMAAGAVLTAAGVPMLILPGPGAAAIVGGAALASKGQRNFSGREASAVEAKLDDAAEKLGAVAKTEAKKAADTVVREAPVVAGKVARQIPVAAQKAAKQVPVVADAVAKQAPKVAKGVATVTPAVAGAVAKGAGKAADFALRAGAKAMANRKAKKEQK